MYNVDSGQRLLGKAIFTGSPPSYYQVVVLNIRALRPRAGALQPLRLRGEQLPRILNDRSVSIREQRAWVHQACSLKTVTIRARRLRSR